MQYQYQCSSSTVPVQHHAYSGARREEPPPSTFSADDLQFLLVFASQASVHVAAFVSARRMESTRSRRDVEGRAREFV